MKKTVCFFLSLLIIFLFCNCAKKKTGVVFTFDDSYVDEWYNYRELFKKYDVCATFYISRPHLLDTGQINKLRILESDGHEIGCHGYLHQNATLYQIPENYIDEQITPALEKLQEMGFRVNSFAYPFGASTPILDTILLKYFKTVRKATYNIQNTTIDLYPEIYANSNSFRIVNSMGVDYNYDITLENFETGVRKAVKNNEILVLHAHIIDTSNGDYSIHPEYLEALFKICKKRGVKSITMVGMFQYFQR